MVTDLRDWYSAVETILTKVSTLDYGNDADKAAAPNIGNCYLAIDTGKLYLCFSTGVWTELPLTPPNWLEDDPTDGELEKAPTSNWAYDHEVATTAIHGVGTGTISSVSTANKTIYVDKAATGDADGTSWTDAFTTIQAAVDSLEDVIIHAYTIRVRKGATPYRETVYLNSNPAVNPAHLILGSLAIEGEFYLQGDCEANVGGAGEITDTGAFGDVLVGDKVYVLDLNGANGRAQDYEVCTVDDISNAPDRIGTDGTKTPTTNWKYVIVRTEISGSDDGTDGGTARDECFKLLSIKNITVNGFYLTFSDYRVGECKNSRSCFFDYCIIDNCDDGFLSAVQSNIEVRYCGFSNIVQLCMYSESLSSLYGRYCGFDVDAGTILFGDLGALLYITFSYFDVGDYGINIQHGAIGYVRRCVISANVGTGVYARYNSVSHFSLSTNSATTPEDPVGTVEGSYIG